MVFVTAVWTASRLWIALWAYAGHRMHPFREPIEGGYRGVSSWALNVWTNYDSTYFLEIARLGYRPLTTAFFPLYPLLLRPFGPDENALALAGIVISNLSFLVALWLLLAMTTLQLGEVTARRAVLALAFFPTAVFTMAVYTDALFLMLALGALYAARRQVWLASGVLGLLAALTRNAGPVLSAALFVEWWMQRRGDGARPHVRDLVWIGLPTLAFVGMQLYFTSRFGRLTLLESQAFFGRAPSLPWMPIARDVAQLGRWVLRFGELRGVVQFLIVLLNVAASCLVFVFALRYRRRLRLAEIVLMCGVMLMQLCFARTYAPYTISSARYVLSTPAFAQSLTLELDRRTTRLMRFLFAGIAVVSCGFFAMLFGIKGFIS